MQTRDGWVDLDNTIEDLLAHPKKAIRIADNSVEMLRNQYLMLAAEAYH